MSNTIYLHKANYNTKFQAFITTIIIITTHSLLLFWHACSKCSAIITHLNIRCITSILKQKNWGPEKFSHWPKVTQYVQLVNIRSKNKKFKPKSSSSKAHTLSHSTVLPPKLHRLICPIFCNLRGSLENLPNKNQHTYSIYGNTPHFGWQKKKSTYAYRNKE